MGSSDKEIATHQNETCFVEDGAEHPGSDRGELARLAHDRVAASQGGGDLERQQVEGQVPGANEGCDPHGGAAHVVKGLRPLHVRGTETVVM